MTSVNLLTALCSQGSNPESCSTRPRVAILYYQVIIRDAWPCTIKRNVFG